MLYDWFIEPILRNGWFNPVNTAVYGILLVLGSWLVFRLLTRLEIRIDLRFAVSLLPFIGWACIARVLKDSATAGLIDGIFSSPIWVTPGSYLLTFGLALSCLLVSLLLQENFGIAYWKTILILGTASCLGLVWMVPRFSPIPPLIVLGITGIWSCLWLFSRKLGMSWENVCILSAHSLDASATVTAVVLFGYLEQHVLPRLLMAFSPYSFFLLKFFVLLPVLFLLDRWTEPGQLRTFLKIVILILGLAPGLRSLIRLGVGV